MEPILEQLKTLYRLCLMASNMFQAINIVRLDERTQPIFVLIGDTIEIEIFSNGEVMIK
ncbi:DUF6888 family protein [Nostoc sp. 'Peltigera membranacea cyanobiont' 213]|uniref:DUF6888 family protein n=1 Tax=Nostoc sp. 'Peltigera membranacea cyanobiont' 213 TaxID=2014530 RepID=UPI00167F1194|nr:hypothetical protein [Nostoc sp. 'Peltigera membranacea cyanobiont' 213]